MKIVYLHGLESNVDQKDPKIIFLNDNFDEVFTPSINYKDKNTFAKLFSKIKAINPDLIVGSSIGGYFAYIIGSKLGIETLLFNPAVIGRAFDPIVDDTNLSGARHNVFLGKSDNVISGKDIKTYFDRKGIGSFKYNSYNGGHRVPKDTFINSIKNTVGIKENDSSLIYTKRKSIKMKHIKTFDYINELKENIKALNINEGQFSWMTQDTGDQIGSERPNTITVYMHDNEGSSWKETKYQGYGEFGGYDYYELLAKMNGYPGEDRQDGIDLAFGKKKPKNSRKVLFPALTKSPRLSGNHDFTKEAEGDPNQSWYQED